MKEGDRGRRELEPSGYATHTQDNWPLLNVTHRFQCCTKEEQRRMFEFSCKRVLSLAFSSQYLKFLLLQSRIDIFGEDILDLTKSIQLFQSPDSSFAREVLKA